MREIARSIARENMKKYGYCHINKENRLTGKSLFSENWRNFVNYNPTTIIVHHKKRVKHRARKLFIPFWPVRRAA